MSIQISGNQIQSNAVSAAKLDLSSGTFDFSSATLQAGTPSADADVTTKNYVDGLVASGVYWKESVKCATTTAIDITADLENGDSIDGITLVTGDRVLVKNQTGDNAPQNGIYIVVASGTASRSSDMSGADQFSGSAMFCEQGTVNGDQGFTCTNNGAVVVGTTDIAFTQFTGTGGIEAGSALTKTNNRLDVSVDDSSIGVVADQLVVKTGGISNAMLSGGISNGKLQNNTISGVALGSSLAQLSPATNGGVLFSNYDGSSAVSNVQLDINNLASAIVDVATDSIAIYDSSEDSTNKEAIADVVTLIAGDGLSATAGVLAVGVDDSSIELNSDRVRVKAGGISNSMLSGGIADDKLSADYVQTSEVDDASIEFSGGTLKVKAGGISNAMIGGGIGDDKLSADYVQTSEVDDSSIEFTGGTLNVKAGGITNAMLSGGISDDKINQITSASKVAGSAIVLATNSGLEDASGLKVATGGISNSMLSGGIGDDKLSADYVQTSEVDDSSIEFSGGTLNVKAGGITNAMISGNVATSKLALQTQITNLSPTGSTATFDLDHALTSNTQLVLAFRNGLCVTQVQSNPSGADEFTISPTAGTNGVAQVVFGANISASDSLKVFYVI